LIYSAGKTYEDWLAAAENPDHRTLMEASRKHLELPSPIEAFIRALPRPVHVIAIAEDWCGDVVRHVPALQRLADVGSQLRVRYIAREDRPDVFARFLTNGGEAIPKFIFLSDRFVECGNWGPMPDACRAFIARGKACGDVGAARTLVAEAYDADTKRQVVLKELASRIDVAASSDPDPAHSTLSAFLKQRS